MRLARRRILITGAASGIGRAAAELFAGEGARLALLDCNADGLASVATATGAIACPADVRDEDAVRQALARIEGELGGLDGVVNSAGIVVHGRVTEINVADWRRMIEVNLIGTFLVCRYAQPLLARSDAGTIVNLASGQALLPAAGNNGYAASKGGVVAFTRAVAAELAPRIRVNAVAPGLVNTPMGVGAMKLDGEGGAQRLAAAVGKYALQRMAEPEEIAQALLFLSSTESSYVTGSLLAVDGGRTFH